jgi:Bifunctional DNA primase/polymerase, N-terminal/Primase C terminal 1 (PriCT-1)
VPRNKTPATTHGLKDATTDPSVIKEWWHHEPAYNVAVTTGAASKIFVVDVDGFDAETNLRKLEVEHGADIPPSVEAITARGRHIYLQYPESPVRNSAGKIAPGIDVRGEGGYVLVPPSVHPSGRSYSWSVDSTKIVAAAPDWLLARANGGGMNGNGSAATTPAEWRELIKGVAEGARDCSTAKLAGYLLRRHVDPFVTLELLQSWNSNRCTPPLPEKDIERIVDSIAGIELRRRGHAGG